MISGFKNVVIPGLVHKTSTQPIDIGLECVRFEEFVGQCGEREVEVVPQLTITEFRRLRDGVPNSLNIGGKGSDEVLQRCCAEVITDNKKQEGFLMRSGVSVLIQKQERVRV